MLWLLSKQIFQIKDGKNEWKKVSTFSLQPNLHSKANGKPVKDHAAPNKYILNKPQMDCLRWNFAWVLLDWITLIF